VHRCRDKVQHRLHRPAQVEPRAQRCLYQYVAAVVLVCSFQLIGFGICSDIQLNASYCAVGPAGTGCTSLYTVASGDYCSKIETAKSISDATLHALNPWLGTFPEHASLSY
jgi:hypothetical protein